VDLSTPDVFQTEVTVSPTSLSDGTVVVSESIPENLVEQGVEFQLFEVDGTTATEVTYDGSTAVEFVDSNGNGIADQIQWEAPLTSETTYVIQGIILITDAQHLDSNRNFIENVYDQTSTLDGIWTSPIPPDDYIRVTYEQPLTSSNDITIYARSDGGNIEVYEKDGTTLVASFGEIGSEGIYKNLLTNLSGSQDTFDLRIVGGPIEFDYITDPHNESGSLEQCRNGSAHVGPTGTACADVAGPEGWVTGNAGSSNAHYAESESIPYRITLDNLATGSHTLILGYDIKHSDSHAIDYLTTAKRTAGVHETVDPCDGISGIGYSNCPITFTGATLNVPADSATHEVTTVLIPIPVLCATPASLGYFGGVTGSMPCASYTALTAADDKQFWIVAPIGTTIGTIDYPVDG
ncbi:MAG: hypothetical protein ACRD38_12015, partial [Nitrososphaerales archaeon]